MEALNPFARSNKVARTPPKTERFPSAHTNTATPPLAIRRAASPPPAPAKAAPVFKAAIFNKVPRSTLVDALPSARTYPATPALARYHAASPPPAPAKGAPVFKTAIVNKQLLDSEAQVTKLEKELLKAKLKANKYRTERNEARKKLVVKEKVVSEVQEMIKVARMEEMADRAATDQEFARLMEMHKETREAQMVERAARDIEYEDLLKKFAEMK